MPAFWSEGVTDDMARDMALCDLKTLGLATMLQAHEFKCYVAEFLLKATRVAAEEHTAAYAIAAPAIAHVLQRMQLQVPCFSAQRATWPPNTLLNHVTYFLI